MWTNVQIINFLKKYSLIIILIVGGIGSAYHIAKDLLTPTPIVPEVPACDAKFRSGQHVMYGGKDAVITEVTNYRSSGDFLIEGTTKPDDD